MLLEAASCAGSSLGSEEVVSDPSVIEQPPSAMATNAIGADARGPRRKAPEGVSATGWPWQDTHAADAILVARSRAFRKIPPRGCPCAAALRCRIHADRRTQDMFHDDPDSIFWSGTWVCWRARPAQTTTRAHRPASSDSNPAGSFSAARADPRRDRHGRHRDRRARRPGPAPNTGFGFIGNRPSRCNFLRASLRARRTASAFSRAFFSEGFS